MLHQFLVDSPGFNVESIALTLRFIKIAMVASIALFFTIVAFDNIISFATNWVFVQHVLSMDTTFHEPAFANRAITNPVIQRYAYYLIIAWELLTATTCWSGCVVLLSKIKAPSAQFNHAKQIAFIGLFFGFLLYMVGFIIIGSEWFSMWQSTTWNAQSTAGLFLSLIMFVMIFVRGET
jgi:predicted small integral membrane protein